MEEQRTNKASEIMKENSSILERYMELEKTEPKHEQIVKFIDEENKKIITRMILEGDLSLDEERECFEVWQYIMKNCEGIEKAIFERWFSSGPVLQRVAKHYEREEM